MKKGDVEMEVDGGGCERWQYMGGMRGGRRRWAQGWKVGDGGVGEGAEEKGVDGG